MERLGVAMFLPSYRRVRNRIQVAVQEDLLRCMHGMFTPLTISLHADPHSANWLVGLALMMMLGSGYLMVKKRTNNTQWVGKLTIQ